MIDNGFDLLTLVSSDTELRKAGRYYIGPCPFCGGDDRFNLKSTRNGDLWICRKCGNGKYESAIGYLMKRNNWSFIEAKNHVFSTNGESLEKRERVVRVVSKKRKERLDAKLREYTTQEIWEALHRRMAEEEVHRQWWRDNGVPDEWQDYLSLGWTPEKRYISSKDGETHASSAYTIPYFLLSKQFVTMQYRMCGDVPVSDRYRFEYDLGTSYYMTTPTMPIGKNVIICEGAKKGIVTRLYAPDMNEFTVLSIPSKQDFGGIESAVKDAEKIWIVLDPDAEDRAEKLASNIGIRDALVVSVPVKLDDAFMSGILTPKSFQVILKQGVKVA
jgi:hypothetical protein